MPSYLTTSDVATRLGVSLDTVRRWLRSGELKGTPFGRAGYRIEDADFQAFLDRRRQHLQRFSHPHVPEPALSNAALESFTSRAGQELRTPLTTTQGTLQQAHRLLQHGLELSLPDNIVDLLTKLQHLLMRAERQVGAEMRLVANMLDASRIQANTFEISPVWCNLVEIVREVVVKQQELAVHRHLELELPADEPVAVIADTERIKQALTHYLTNALKFSQTDQPINISLQVSEVEARVAVQDRGAGIPLSEQQGIWEYVQQVQRQPAGPGSGLGLGLYITRAIIQQHGGQVGCESHVGEGSTLWFTLPLADETWH